MRADHPLRQCGCLIAPCLPHSRTHIRSRARICTQVGTRTRKHARTHARTHGCSLARTHALSRVHTHACTPDRTLLIFTSRPQLIVIHHKVNTTTSSTATRSPALWQART